MLDQVDAVLRRPEPFLVGQEERAVGVEADAVRGAEAGGQDLGLRAVLADLQQRAVVRHQGGQGVAGGLGVVEVPLRVGLQAHRELVEVLGHLVVVVEALVEVGLAVAVEVVQAHDLVAAADVDLARRRSSAPAAGTGPRRSAARSAPSRVGRCPSTSQTSPSQVQTAARRPSARKSKPVSRSWQIHGLLSGRVRTSTANGPSSRPIDGPASSAPPASASGRPR